MAKEEHERLMQEKRERIAAQQQATLEAEIALEELRLQRLRQREEAERLEGPFRRTARDTSRDRQRRQDAEAARRVAEGTTDRGEETWVDVDRSKGTGAAKRNAKGRGKGGWTPMLDRLGRVDVSYPGLPKAVPATRR